jgi:tetratricopeptide (TPR) repeat protein
MDRHSPVEPRSGVLVRTCAEFNLSAIHRPQRMLPLQSPLEAYRSDLSRHPSRTDFGRSDTVWLLVAHCLHRLSRAQRDARRSIAENCAAAINDLATTVSPDTPEEAAMLTELDRMRRGLVTLDIRRGATEVVVAARALADQMGDAGALWLAFSTLGHARLAAPTAEPRELGLAMADQGWVARSLGDLDSADELYEGVAGAGATHNEPELRARALLGQGVNARVRGNYPKARAAFRDGLAIAAAADLHDLQSIGHQGLLIAAITAGDSDTALVHGWAAFELACGYPDREAEILINLSHVSMVAGYADAALRGFVASLRRSPASRFRLPSLGGAAVAAARVGNRDLVTAIARTSEDSLITGALPFESASALRSLSEAFETIGDAARAEDYRLRARALARKNGFFEIVLATEPKDLSTRTSVPQRRELERASRQVIESLEAMDAEVDSALVALTP